MIPDFQIESGKIMLPLTLKLKKKEIIAIKEFLKYEEPRVIKRANILNCLHHGYASSEISIILNVDQKTVTNVGNAYLEDGFDSALYDDERSGRPIDFDDRERSRIIAMVCTNPPSGSYRWTLDLIVDEAEKRGLIDQSISREQVRIILQEHDLKPWQEKMWCIGNLDEEYIKKMEDVLDVYARPYAEKMPVICIDEKPVPLISDIRDRILPDQPGDILKKDYEYARNGSVNVFCAVEPKAGKYFNTVTKQRCGSDFSKFIKSLSEKYNDAEKIVLVMDNLSTHKEKHLIEYYGESEGKKIWNKFEVHYTPKHGSWLNQAEIAIGMYSRQCLGDGRVGTIENLKFQTRAWNKRMNKKQTKINWRFTKSKARKSLGYTPVKHSEKLI
jgi:transposase